MTWNTVKLIAMVCMAIDHIDKTVSLTTVFGNIIEMSPAVEFALSDIITFVGRISFPIYAYGIAQCCVYTRNLKRYIFRLLGFALVSEIPYQLAFNDLSELQFGLTNVLFTLSTGALCCGIIAYFKQKGKNWIFIFPTIIILLFSEIVGMNYGAIGVLSIVVTYCFYGNRKKRFLALGTAMVFFYVFTAKFMGFSVPLQWMRSLREFKVMIVQVLGALTGVLIVTIYNEKQGKKQGKFLYYIFYPTHLLLLHFVAMDM